ncbi:hypothetical protein [Geobacillus stearothermophilus]|uniref:hypothetical protein n=1 Tax=Geobacillus stearothermophilus TaxID=1422 RepID=UPI00240276CF|nr:hypothetical protein [Geobacillus stearothermophilus]MDF9296083.1 hypothetical protein [Geobacillus stearothermophilus]
MINHVTLNTGHIRKSKSDEVDKGLYFVLHRLTKEIFSPNGASVVDGYIAKGTRDDDGDALITVFSMEGAPIVTIGMTKRKNSPVWGLLHETSTLPLATSPNHPPEAPYVADRIEPGALFHTEALEWTGDFSRCMAWICLYPEKIR